MLKMTQARFLIATCRIGTALTLTITVQGHGSRSFNRSLEANRVRASPMLEPKTRQNA
jgi:hypothetical protein